jgi:hypothetical protein
MGLDHILHIVHNINPPAPHAHDEWKYAQELSVAEDCGAARHLPADEISARISAEMKDWIRDAEQYDDLTFIVMKLR